MVDTSAFAIVRESRSWCEGQKQRIPAQRDTTYLYDMPPDEYRGCITKRSEQQHRSQAFLLLIDNLIYRGGMLRPYEDARFRWLE